MTSYKGVKMDQILRALERVIEELSESLFKQLKNFI